MNFALAAEADRTVRVAVIQITWDFWTIFWIFWIVLVPVGLLVWMTVWVLRRYNRDLKERETLYKTAKHPAEHAGGHTAQDD